MKERSVSIAKPANSNLTVSVKTTLTISHKWMSADKQSNDQLLHFLHQHFCTSRPQSNKKDDDGKKNKFFFWFLVPLPSHSRKDLAATEAAWQLQRLFEVVDCHMRTAVELLITMAAAVSIPCQVSPGNWQIVMSCAMGPARL